MRKIHRKFRNGSEKIKRALHKTGDKVTVKFKKMQHGVTDYVKKNPMKTIGISVIAGALISQIGRLRK